MKLFILFVFMGVISLSAQNDWVKWNSKVVSYELPNNLNKDNILDQSGFGLTILSVLQTIYYFFISDLDGNNCAFTPSCSSFFLQAVSETSIFKGTLMFADRFTRDINFFKGSGHYLLLPSNKFFDSPYNYTLHSEKIKL